MVPQTASAAYHSKKPPHSERPSLFRDVLLLTVDSICAAEPGVKLGERPKLSYGIFWWLTKRLQQPDRNRKRAAPVTEAARC
jgi:hypothetical protein